jgi:hypothetical protein
VLLVSDADQPCGLCLDATSDKALAVKAHPKVPPRDVRVGVRGQRSVVAAEVHGAARDGQRSCAGLVLRVHNKKPRHLGGPCALDAGVLRRGESFDPHDA